MKLSALPLILGVWGWCVCATAPRCAEFGVRLENASGVVIAHYPREYSIFWLFNKAKVRLRKPITVGFCWSNGTLTECRSVM